ncbi:tubulin monoglutamylase TTLL4 [Hyla sarda]|uniref:tubulin monoglutamylase TTLL4 n=1 Tax=Hyla sarda TaxID=327740 RepID=UPI0024C36DBC|nr:tubulin monoglutamylase TTLL4 [Hyla sarda]XP_056392821.1 tubulin monoglutamylase TTLL4 [Hyla sarda]XP_056392823.1 tubulin monoglutamylase TTLL4 [Hyla sarda]
MASGETQIRIAELRGEVPQKPTSHPDKPKEPKGGSSPSPKLSPIWKPKREHVHLAQNHRSAHSMFPRPSCLFSETSTPLTPSPPATGPRPLHDTLERTFVFHRASKNPTILLIGQKTESHRTISTRYRYPPVRPFLKSAKTERAMTSSLVDQFHLPSAAGELPDVGIRRPSSVAAKLPSDPSRPALIPNSFLRPSSTKVPLHVDKKTTPNPPQVGAKSASWSSGEKGGFGQPNGVVPSVNHTGIRARTVFCKAASSSSIMEGKARVEETTWHILENNNVGSSPNRDIQLTEAVRRLTGSHGLAGGEAQTSTKAFCQNENPRAISATAQPACPGHKKDPIPNSLASEGPSLKIDTSVSSTYHANACTQQTSASLGAKGDDSCPLDVSAHLPALKNEPLLPVTGETSHRGNITVMASQISTIHLNKPGEDVANNFDITVPNSELDAADEELPEGLDDTQEEEEDEEDPAAVPASSSTTPLADPSRQCVANMDLAQSDVDLILRPALTPSLFPNTTPTIYFATQDEKVELLPWAQRKLLKWKMSTVTPNIVKQTIARSHFRITKKNDWLACWGHHMKSTGFKAIKDYQKLNHFPGSFQIGRKDRLWRNLSKMQARFGRKEFNFFPQSFVLPQDIKLLRKAWEEGGTRQKWIVKPPASARGMGIQVIHKWSQLPKRRPLLVQRYLHKPYLISGSKFDLRIYVYVTSYDPLRVYLFNDGLVRFASCKYSSSMKSLSNKFMHLTNYSVNKKNVDYKANADESACQGHKWALKALWSYLNQKGFSSDKIWEKIKEMVIKTIIASEPYVNSLMKMYVQNPHSCHELFGFDIMLDENLKPWVLEVNISPSLHSNSPLDVKIKGQMICDLLNLAGFLLPNKETTSPSIGNSSSSVLGRDHGHSAEIVNEEKMKRAHYLSQKMPDKDLYATVLDHLTPEDVRVLVETEDELSRCGQFERVFPSAISSRYLRFFEQQRYFNILTNQWEQKYYASREKGQELLRSLCMMNFHTGSAAHSSTWSLQRSPGQSATCLNGCHKGDATKPSRLPPSPEEELKSLKNPPLHQSPVHHPQPDLSPGPLLSHIMSTLPESALVM